MPGLPKSSLPAYRKRNIFYALSGMLVFITPVVVIGANTGEYGLPKFIGIACMLTYSAAVGWCARLWWDHRCNGNTGRKCD